MQHSYDQFAIWIYFIWKLYFFYDWCDWKWADYHWSLHKHITHIHLWLELGLSLHRKTFKKKNPKGQHDKQYLHHTDNGLLPPAEPIHYLSRKSNIRLAKTTTKYLFNSFMQSSIRLWNNIDNVIQDLTDLHTFTTALKPQPLPAATYESLYTWVGSEWG